MTRTVGWLPIPSKSSRMYFYFVLPPLSRVRNMSPARFLHCTMLRAEARALANSESRRFWRKAREGIRKPRLTDEDVEELGVTRDILEVGF